MTDLYVLMRRTEVRPLDEAIVRRSEEIALRYLLF